MGHDTSLEFSLAGRGHPRRIAGMSPISPAFGGNSALRDGMGVDRMEDVTDRSVAVRRGVSRVWLHRGGKERIW